MDAQNKLYVGNLSYTINDDSLRQLFSEFGQVTEAVVITDKFHNNRSKGFGFVTMSSDEEANKAMEAMNGKEVDGRALKVNIARPLERR